MRTFLSIALVSVVTAAYVSLQTASDSIAQEPAAEPTSRVVLTSEVKWEQLNPARGDKSPSAGTLWGDRNGSGPTGFLLKPTDGFESPLIFTMSLTEEWLLAASFTTMILMPRICGCRRVLSGRSQREKCTLLQLRVVTRWRT